MSELTWFVKCPQCEYAQADALFHNRRNTSDIMCRRCGYVEHAGPLEDKSGEECGWKHEAKYGTGALGYDNTFRMLHSEEAVTEAVNWLRAALANGQFDPTICYVTRWNKQGKQVEVVVGSGPQLRPG